MFVKCMQVGDCRALPLAWPCRNARSVFSFCGLGPRVAGRAVQILNLRLQQQLFFAGANCLAATCLLLRLSFGV